MNAVFLIPGALDCELVTVGRSLFTAATNLVKDPGANMDRYSPYLVVSRVEPRLDCVEIQPWFKSCDLRSSSCEVVDKCSTWTIFLHLESIHLCTPRFHAD